MKLYELINLIDKSNWIKVYPINRSNPIINGRADRVQARGVKSEISCVSVININSIDKGKISIRIDYLA